MKAKKFEALNSKSAGGGQVSGFPFLRLRSLRQAQCKQDRFHGNDKKEDPAINGRQKKAKKQKLSRINNNLRINKAGSKKSLY
jgi:hypothetical protein